MRIENEMFIWFRRSFRPAFKIEVVSNGVTSDFTTRIIEVKWRKPVTTAIGDFIIKLNNADRTLSGFFLADDIVRIYADLSSGTTKVFEGFLDFPKETYSREGGSYIELIGRHVAGELLEKMVTYASINEEVSVTLKNIIADVATGFTSVNVATTTTNTDVNYVDKPLWDCVIDLCERTGYDCYVDDSKDFHFFEKNSRINIDDAIVMEDNFIDSSQFGGDSFTTKNKVTVVGETDDGLPILFTKQNPGARVREYLVKDVNIQTDDYASNLAISKLSTIGVTNEQGIIKSLGLPYARPGDKIWVSLPNMNIHARLRILSLNHTIGRVGWLTETLFEKEIENEPIQMQQRISAEKRLSTSANWNKMQYSYIMPFDDSSQIASSTTTGVSGSKLMLLADNTTGIMQSNTKTSDVTIAAFEVRATGQDLDASTFKVSADNGISWCSEKSFSSDTWVEILLNEINQGNIIAIEVTLNSDSTNTTPQIETLCLLWRG